VPECKDALVNLLWDAITGETELRRERMKEILDRNPLIGYNEVTEKDISNLNNHFNA
jgi:hypothetical protein